jgi:hypothetical protein
MKKIFTLVVVLMFSAAAYAQFSLYGEFRPRTEFNHGYKTLMPVQGEMFSLVTSQRTRLGLGYTAKMFKVGLQIQDVRAWGSTSQLVVGDGAYTTVHQAWAELMFNEKFSLKVGRMELNYDDQRMLGSVNWAQQARSHDLALFKYEDGFKLHVGLAVNQAQTNAYTTPKNYKAMQFLWFHKKFSDAYSLSLLVLNNGVADTTLNNGTGSPMTTYSQTIGQRSVFKTGALSVGLNFYYQMGDDKSVYYDTDAKLYDHRKFSAMNIGLDIGFKLNDNFKLGVGYEFLSGQSQTDTSADYRNTNHAFNPLYGTNHKFNGWMDYFYVGNHINNVGLQDIYFKLDYKKKKFLAGASFHYFMSAAEVMDMDEFINSGNITAMSSGLGMELDTYVGYKHTKGVIIKGGISGMFDSETMRAIKGGDNGASNYWGWLMIAVNPTFLNGK